MLSRGRRPPPAGVEALVGDRDGDLSALEGRRFDAVLDVSTFGPRWVRTLVGVLASRVGHYSLVSSQDVYAAPHAELGGTTEEAPLRRYSDASDPSTGHSVLYRTPGLGPTEARLTYLGIERAKQMYGALKVLCEHEASAFAHALVLRPTLIVGPGDRNPAFPFLLGRVSQGGEVLLAGSPGTPVQLIDARDVARWWVDMVEKGATGTFNVAGPPEPLDYAGLLATVAGALGVEARFEFVPTRWLIAQEDFWPMGALFWSQEPGGFDNPANLVTAAARAQGLVTRPLGETVGFVACTDAPSGTVAALAPGADGGSERVVVPWGEYCAREHAALARWRAASG